MGRIVYFSLPAHGHINPTLPVVRELSHRGHEVTYFSTARFHQSIQETGVQFRSYHPDFCMPEQGPGAFAHVSATLESLLDQSCTVLEKHLEEVRALRPNHILFDSFAPWGAMIAQLLDLPAIASVPSILVNAQIAARYGNASAESEDARLTPQWYAAFEAQCHARLSRFRLAVLPSPPQLLQTYGDLNLVYTSRAFQPSAEAFDDRRFRFVGPCFSFRPKSPPFPFRQLDGRPLVYVSLGTVYGRQPGFIRACTEELAGGPWQVVLATGGLSMDSWGPLPGNFLAQSFVPQIDILRRAAAFVTHAGMNSIQEALYHAVPMVTAPLGADQFWLSARAAELGTALALNPLQFASGSIRASVARILSEPGFASAAGREGRALRSAGGHRRAADEIDNIVQASS